MARALRVILLVLAGAVAAHQEECEDVEEAGLMQKRGPIGGRGGLPEGRDAPWSRNGMKGGGNTSSTPAPGENETSETVEGAGLMQREGGPTGHYYWRGGMKGGGNASSTPAPGENETSETVEEAGLMQREGGPTGHYYWRGGMKGGGNTSSTPAPGENETN